MKVGFSYWGFCENFDECNEAQTPDGHRYGRPIFVKELWKRGHEITALQRRREQKPFWQLRYDASGYPEIDVLFVEWRWPTYKNWGPHKFESDLDRQHALLNYYHGKVPIIAWDTDLKMTPEDEERWPEMIVADPTFDPTSFIIPRTRLTFWSDFKPLMKPSEGSIEFGYIGNNYERAEMFEKYYSKPSHLLRRSGVQTKVWGNWLQHSPERALPEDLIKRHHSIAFCDRVSFKESMHLLNKFIATVHITKPRYALQGFASPRYLENIVTNTPALVPEEFRVNDILGKEWTISSTQDIFDRVLKLKSLNVSDRRAIVDEQAYNLLRVHDFSVGAVVDFIEGVMNNVGEALRNA